MNHKNNFSQNNTTHNKSNWQGYKKNIKLNYSLPRVAVFKINKILSLPAATNYFHTSSILKSTSSSSSSVATTAAATTATTNVNVSNYNIVEQLRERSERIERERLIEIQKIQYKDKYGTDVDSELEDNMSTFGECFPWFLDSDGKIIDYNKSMKLFDAIKIVSKFLETRLGMDNTKISEVKISEILKPFENGADVTVLDLFKHIQQIYEKDENFFKNTNDLNVKVPEGSQENFSKDSLAKLPLGLLPLLGEMTLNELLLKVKDLKWEAVGRANNNLKITVNTVPLAVNLIGFNLILKSYMKYVHNRPYQNDISMQRRNLEQSLRRRNLALFVFLGAPLILFSSFARGISIPMKNMGSIEVLSGNTISGEETDSLRQMKTSDLFLILSNLNKKIPDIVKLIFKLFLVILIVLKLFGVNFIDLFFNLNYLRIYFYVSVSLVIIYQLLNLYLISLFSRKKIKIFEFLPEFFINWLKEFEFMVKSQDSLKAFKQMCYIELFIYVSLLIILLIFF